MDPLLGTDVGNYRLIRVLGEGGMGRVYVGEQAAIASRVAIKVMTTKDPDLVARFFAEAKAVNVIKHPGLVKVVALANLPDGRPYIIMELVEGETLRALVERDSPLPVAGVVDTMKQLLGALEAAHARGVVHRDLKPDNVMLTPDGTVKVLDFGIAKLSPTVGGSITPRTRTGSQIGTPAYMAPEQIRGFDVDARTDLYTAGVVMFEALTGSLPFEPTTEFELMRAHLEVAPPRASSLRPDLPPALDAIIDQVLAKRPEERFQSATALVAALSSLRLPAEKLIGRPAVSMQLAVADVRANQALSHATVDDRPKMPDVTRPASPRPRIRDDAPPERATVDARRPSDRALHEAVPDTRRERRGANRWWFAIPAVVVVGGAIVAAFVLGKRVAPREQQRGGGGGSAVVAMGAGTAPSVSPGAGSPSPMVGGAPAGMFDIKRSKDEIRGTLSGKVDPATFDPIASIPRAKELAQQLMPGVVFTEVLIGDIDRGGTITFSPSGYASYGFALPNVNADTKTDCRVTVALSVAGWTGVTGNSFCKNDGEVVLHCDLEEVWTRAIKRGASSDALADVRLKDRTWWFSQPGGAKKVSLELPDDCATKTPRATAGKTTTASPVTTAAPTTTGATPNSGTPKPTIVSKPYDFDPKHFDLIAYIPKARAWAREIVPGVELTTLTFNDPPDDGIFDLTTNAMNMSAILFMNADSCWAVGVTFAGGRITASPIHYETCFPPAQLPRCKAGEVLRRLAQPRPQFLSYNSLGWSAGSRLIGDDCP